MGARLGNAVFRALASWLTGRDIPTSRPASAAARRERLLEIIHLLPNGFSYPTTSLPGPAEGRATTSRSSPSRARARVGKSKIRALRDGVKFLLIILKIVTLYRPLKVFFPVSLSALLMGHRLRRLERRHHGKIPMGAAIALQLAVVVFLFGLVSEQIASSQERR